MERVVVFHDVRWTGVDALFSLIFFDKMATRSIATYMLRPAVKYNGFCIRCKSWSASSVLATGGFKLRFAFQFIDSFVQ
jgi:hypothetical protein